MADRAIGAPNAARVVEKEFQHFSTHAIGAFKRERSNGNGQFRGGRIGSLCA